VNVLLAIRFFPRLEHLVEARLGTTRTRPATTRRPAYVVPLGNYVIAVGNYLIATALQLGNYVIADSQRSREQLITFIEQAEN
jgi:hypothetical protein